MTQVYLNVDGIVDSFPSTLQDDVFSPETPPDEHRSSNAYELLATRSITPDADILSELCRMSDLPEPIYEVTQSDTWEYFAKVTIGDSLVFRTTAPSYASIVARADAAEVALDFLSRCGSAFYRDEYEEPIHEEIIHDEPAPANGRKLLIPDAIPRGSYVLALMELCQMNGFRCPVYDFNAPPFEDGWTCEVTIFVGDDEFYQLGEGDVFRTQRDTKKDAARAAFEAFAEMA